MSKALNIKVDTSELRRSISRLKPLVKDSRNDLVKQAARGTIRHVIEVTPPASAKAGGRAAKLHGEATILGDLAKIMFGVPARKNLESARSVHDRFRGKRGRVKELPRNQRIPVAKKDLQLLLKTLQKSVGTLAAGWNAAALALGVHVPAWIKRHGDSFGSMKIASGDSKFTVVAENSVEFVGDVKNYTRRLQAAVNYEAKALGRKADFLMRRALRKSGFKNS